jgi:hypothetical protein
MLNEQPILIWSTTQNKWISTLIYFVDQPATTTNIQDIDGAGDHTTTTPSQTILTFPSEPTSGYCEILPLGSIFPTSKIWYIDNTKTIKIMEEDITWLGVVPIYIIYTFYAADGIAIIQKIQDIINYTKKIIITNITRTVLI